jgi:hypothetical protein
MHPTTDTLPSRYCKVFLLTPEAVVPASVPRWLHEEAEKLQSEPMLDRVESLVGLLAKQTWVEQRPRGRRREVTGSDATRTAKAVQRRRSNAAAESPLKVTEVRLELWKAVPEEIPPDAASETLMLSVTRKVADADSRPLP